MIFDQLRREHARRDFTAYSGGPGIGRHRLIGHDDRTEELPRMTFGTREESLPSDHETGVCRGEDRADPASWDDPDIFDEPWREPYFVAPATPGTSILGDADLED